MGEDAKKNYGHRWSGWPGAWCLDCGIEWEADLDDERKPDPRINQPCSCPNSDKNNPYKNYGDSQ